MKIAVDAMGGDHAPKAIVLGVLEVSEDYPDVEFQLFGDATQIQPLVQNKSNIQVIHAEEKIEGHDIPVQAVRKKKKASMVLASRAVKEGEADALISAGNTGALLAASLLIIGRMQGIERPALMTTLPTLDEARQGFDFLDIGANAESKPEHLHQYGILGSYYAKNVRNIARPRVALLNNGTEASKGTPVHQKAYERLQNEVGIHFIGNVEARDLLMGVADVVVTDGFTGNAVLKAMEGTALSVMKTLKQSILNEGTKGKLGALLLKPAFQSLKDELDYTDHGGAVLIGVQAPVLKMHGSSQAHTVAQALKQVIHILNSRVIEAYDDVFTYKEEKVQEKADALFEDVVKVQGKSQEK